MAGLVPKLMQRFDIRLIAFVGTAFFALSAFMNTAMSPDYSGDQLFIPNIVRAIGQALLLAPLSANQRARLVGAMEVVERLLTASLVTIDIENPRSEAARLCIASYFAELNDRFENGFDPGRSISADAEELTEPAGVLLIARLRGDPVGCGALKLHGRGPAEIKRMWIDLRARGLGVGRRILGELEQHARQRRVRVLRLETNRSLVEAQNLYRSAGFVEVERFNEEPYAHHWFQKRLSAVSGRSSRKE